MVYIFFIQYIVIKLTMGLCYGHSEIFFGFGLRTRSKNYEKDTPYILPKLFMWLCLCKKNVALRGMKKDRLENCARLARIQIILLTTHTFLRLNLKLHHSVNILFLQINLEVST